MNFSRGHVYVCAHCAVNEIEEIVALDKRNRNPLVHDTFWNIHTQSHAVLCGRDRLHIQFIFILSAHHARIYTVCWCGFDAPVEPYLAAMWEKCACLSGKRGHTTCQNEHSLLPFVLYPNVRTFSFADFLTHFKMKTIPLTNVKCLVLRVLFFFFFAIA